MADLPSTRLSATADFGKPSVAGTGLVLLGGRLPATNAGSVGIPSSTGTITLERYGVTLVATETKGTAQLSRAGGGLWSEISLLGAPAVIQEFASAAPASLTLTRAFLETVRAEGTRLVLIGVSEGQNAFNWGGEIDDLEDGLRPEQWIYPVQGVNHSPVSYGIVHDHYEPEDFATYLASDGNEDQYTVQVVGDNLILTTVGTGVGSYIYMLMLDPDDEVIEETLELGFEGDATMIGGESQPAFDVVIMQQDGTGTATLRSASKALTLRDVALQVYALWSIEATDLTRTTVGRARIVAWINAAMQQIYSRAYLLGHFNTEPISVTVTSSGELALDETIQRVQGPVRIGSNALRPLTSRGEYDGFSALYVGDGDTPSAPMAYYLAQVRQGDADSMALTLCLAPAPAESVTVALQVTKEPPRYDEVDLLRGVVVQMPHKWAETLLLPLVRKWASGDSRNSNKDPNRQKQIDEGYSKALEILGLTAADTPAASQNKARMPKEAAA